MIIDATFWVGISFLLFFAGLIYLKVPQKVNEILNNLISNIKNEKAFRDFGSGFIVVR